MLFPGILSGATPLGILIDACLDCDLNDVAEQIKSMNVVKSGDHWVTLGADNKHGNTFFSQKRTLNRLFKLAIDRQISRIVVEHKDRLTRFNFGVFEVFFKSHGVEIEWAENVLPKSYEAELVEDMISLMSSFSARIYGKRSAENARKKREAAGGNQTGV